MVAIIAFLFFSAHSDPIPFENLAPRVKLARLSSSGLVTYYFKDGGVRLKLKDTEAKLAQEQPAILASLIQSYRTGEWIKIEATEANSEARPVSFGYVHDRGRVVETFMEKPK